jgi:hypothetical protein
MQLEIDGREQASALSKEQVAPSGGAGGGHLGTLAPYLTRKSGNLMGAAHSAYPFAAQGFASPCVKKRSQGSFRNVGRIVHITDS